MLSSWWEYGVAIRTNANPKIETIRHKYSPILDNLLIETNKGVTIN